MRVSVLVQLFERLLRERPEAVSKLVAVAGDCSLLKLGLSAEDEAMLAANVSYIFHAAATVRFDDPLRTAVLLNTRGTREVVELAKKMVNLKVSRALHTLSRSNVLEWRERRSGEMRFPTT